MHMEGMLLVTLGPILILAVVMPFFSPQVEKNIELFLLSLGTTAVWLSGQLSGEVIMEALLEPLPLSGAVLLSGLLFRSFHRQVVTGVVSLKKKMPSCLFFFLLTAFLGLTSSIFTAIITSLFLVEIIGIMALKRRSKVLLVIIGCYSIGLGASLTPLGEPLATIAIVKLEQDFFYLFRLLGHCVLPGIILLSILAGVIGFFSTPGEAGAIKARERIAPVLARAGKVYLFMIALVFLGQGLEPLIEAYLLEVESRWLYWINMISAVLDNATLTAAEINPGMSHDQVQAILMGLLISGGMLIPGNIPNIISANRLGIGSREWAGYGLPIGLALMILYYFAFFVIY